MQQENDRKLQYFFKIRIEQVFFLIMSSDSKFYACLFIPIKLMITEINQKKINHPWYHL